MGIGYSYVSCIEFDKPRPLLQAILGQLKVVCLADSSLPMSLLHLIQQYGFDGCCRYCA